MTVTKYSNGRIVRNSFRVDALDDLREEFPDMVLCSFPEQTLVFPNETAAASDDGSKAVAVLTIENPNF